MIPIGDDNRGRSLSPIVNWILIIANLIVFIYEFTLPLQELEQLVYEYGAIPAEIVPALQPPGLDHASTYATLLTSMFMHGSIAHFAGNMLFLWIFGDNIEDAMGHLNYLVFYLVGGLAASAGHIFFNPESVQPMIGASGAISAVLAAYMLLFPTGMVRVLIFIGLPLIFAVPALLMIGLWFATQILSGLASLEGAGEATGGVAFWAHVGGFVAGAVLVWIFRDPNAVARQKSIRSGRRPFRRI